MLYFLVTVVVINCGYYLLFSKFSFLPAQKFSSKHFPVSVIVCAKNEAENLTQNIPHWLNQDHPEFELILINDASYDNSLEIMERFAQTDSRIKIVDVQNNEAFWGSKKYALTLGIKKATYKRMLFTDADCKPASSQWISQMTAQFSEEKQLILGYGAYLKQKGILNKLIRFETLLTALQYFSYAKAGIPYMGVGRNLAYTSSLYYQHNGFMSHIKIASGDDDLFVNEAATKKNTAICFSKESFTYSFPKTTFSEWKKQKKRHISTAKYYQLKHKLLLGLFYLSNVLFWVLGVATLFLLDWKIPVLIIFFRLVIQWIVFAKAAIQLDEKDLRWWIPFFEVFLLFIQFGIFVTNFGSKQTSWK